MTKCEKCGEYTYIIHVDKDHRKLCDECYYKKGKGFCNMNLQEKFYDEGIIVDGHFKLNSGKHTDKYIYKDKIYCNGELFCECIDELTTMILKSGLEIDCVASPSAGGVVLGAPVAIDINKPLIYGEKNGGGFKLRKCFREFVKDKNIIIVDDIYSSGKTISLLQKVIIENGGSVVGVFCIWNRSLQKSLDRHTFTNIRSLVTLGIDAYDYQDCYQCKEGLPITNLK